MFIEVSPHPVLAAAIEDTLAAGQTDPAAVIGTLRRGQGGAERMLLSAAELFARGVAVDWAGLLAARGGRRADVPTYAFVRQRYWPPPPVAMPVVAGDGEQTRFWAAVERGDVAALAGAVDADEQARAALGGVLPVLSAWRRASRDRQVVDQWRYRVTWQPVTDPGPGSLAGEWLVVVPAGDSAGEVARACTGALTAHGGRVVPVAAGSDLDRAALAGQIRDVLSRPADVAGVVSLLALDERPCAGCAGITAGVAGTLVLVQALDDAGAGGRWWVLTQGAVAAGPGDQPGSVAQAQVWGLGRVAALEYPDRWGGLVDLPPQLSGRAGERLCWVLGGAAEQSAAEDQVAVREAAVLARRLVRVPLPGGTGEGWMPSGTVLVTGGTGALGGQVARWVTGRGADRVVLASRQGPTAAGVAGLAARLAGRGAGVVVSAGDVADRGSLGGLLGWLRRAGWPVSAVFHAAGVGQFTALADTSLAELEAVARAKVGGAANLDALLADDEVDAFVLFSSASGVWGSGRQGAYAAANAYLDALAGQRRARGAAGTSVAWGLWGGGGMAVGAEEDLRRRGLRDMAPHLGIMSLGQVLDHGEDLVTVADVDWQQFVAAFTSMRPSPLLAGVPEAWQAIQAAAQGGASEGAEPGQGELAGRLAGLTPAKQEQLVLEVVRAQAARVLGHSSVEDVATGAVFRELGFDSLMAVDFRDRLAAATGLRLPATLVFDCPTPVAVADYLLPKLAGTPAPVAPTVVVRAASEEPVAIVGMSCRFPGGVATPEQLWDLVASGTDAVSAFPADRGWEAGGRDGADGGGFTQAGGFVYDAADFDPGFFGISPREALAMDPQQRFLLELAWEAFERAGIDPASVRGTPTGIFAGTNGPDYASLLTPTAERGGGHMLTGNAGSVVSGRVAYVFGLEGPAVSVDTACSSSLVALHLACQAVRSGECTMALAGGVTVMATPAVFAEFSRQGGLAADGRCKAFSAAADGMGWAEGAGLVLVERLSDAQRLGHRVLAVVAGSAVNQDGASNGLTAPNGPSQQRVIRQALAAAGVSPAGVDTVEGHGTGTRLGDPIEAQALLATYGQDRPDGEPLWLGSVKSNIGHAQAAAGIAGVIKTVMALQAAELPPTLHAAEPSPHVDWSAGAVRLLTGPRPWPDAGRPRRAGVSSFGISGTNAHLILEQAPPEPQPVPAPASGAGGVADAEGAGARVVPWVVSGRGVAGLGAQARRLAGFARGGAGGAGLADVGYSLAAGRACLADRAVVVADGVEGMVAGLAAVAAGEPASGVAQGTAATGGGPPRVAFVFAGQGSQRAGMGRGLAARFPVFAGAVGEVCGFLDPLLGCSVEEVIFADASGEGDARVWWIRRCLRRRGCSRWGWRWPGCWGRGG